MPAGLDEAMQLKRAGDLDGAVIAIEALLTRSPSHPQALAQLADTQLRRGRLGEATEALDQAEGLAGTTPFTARIRGDLHYRAQRFREAARSYQDADALGEKGTWSLVQLARCQIRLRDLAGARGTAARAAEREPRAAAPFVVLGDVAMREGDLDEAEAMYARAHERSPADEWAYAKLVEARLGRLPADLRDREVAVLLKSTAKTNRHLMGVLARIRSERGDVEEAADTWAERARQHGDRYAHKMQGFALRRAGRLDEAAGVLSTCLLEDPEDLVLFRTYLHLQRQRGAIEELRKTLEDLLPRAGARRGAVYGELRKLPVAAEDGGGAGPAGGEGTVPAGGEGSAER